MKIDFINIQIQFLIKNSFNLFRPMKYFKYLEILQIKFKLLVHFPDNGLLGCFTVFHHAAQNIPLVGMGNSRLIVSQQKEYFPLAVFKKYANRIIHVSFNLG